MPDSPDLPGPVPFAVSDRDRDLMIRTVVGEAGAQSPREQAAVAHSIVNRVFADGYPDTVGGVVLQNNGRTFQYEPWFRRRGELLSLSPDAPSYRKAAQTVDDVLAGSVPDFSGGATHFYAPAAQAMLGRAAPAWGRSGGTQVGATRFFAPNGPVSRAPAVPPIDLTGATPTTLEGAGIAPRAVASQPSTQPQGTTMSKASTGGSNAAPAAGDDGDLISAFMGGAKPASANPSAATNTAPAGNAGPSASTTTSRGTPGTGGPSAADPDDFVAAFTAGLAGPLASGGEDVTGRVVTHTAPYQMPAGMPAPVTAEGIRDPKTGDLVLAGKPFTDNGADKWSGVVNFANGGLLGAAAPIMAATQAVKEKLTNGADLGSTYRQALAVYGGARDDYAAQNPGAAVATQLAGSIPTTVAATAAGGGLLGAAGNRLLAAVGPEIAPYLAGAGRFLTGQAGRAIPATADAAAVPGNLLARAASGFTAGIAAGATGGAINTGLTGGSVVDNARQGAELGAFVGGGLPLAGGAIGGTVNRLTGTASPDLAALAQTARDTFGLPVRAAEITSSPLVRGADAALSKVPLSGYSGLDAAKQVALNKAVAGQIGEDAASLTPSVMQAAKTRLAAVTDRLARGTKVSLDDALAGDLNDVFASAATKLPKADLPPLQKAAQDVTKQFGADGEMTGAAYLGLTGHGSALDTATRSANPTVRAYAGQIRGVLDDALARSAPADVVAQLQQARGQLAALRTVEPLVNKSGNVDPKALYAAVSEATPGMAYGEGGALADLARAGQAFGPQGAAGAPQQAASALDRAVKFAQAAGGVSGAAVGVGHYGPQLNALTNGMALPAAAGTAAGLVGGRLASSALRSDALANQLITQALGTGQRGPVTNALQAAVGVAPEAAGAGYNPLVRYMQGTPGNDNETANRLAAFMASRPRQMGGMLP